MAVENKFKLNFIAASVLMGLSLSAVASVPAQNSSSKTTETTTVTKTLAEAVKAVNPTEVTFEQGMSNVNPSGASDLVGLLEYMTADGHSRENITTSV
ncbi:hypothetical protein NEE60_005132, partial [Salmonella enterica]